jgi:hypothetical protein
MGDLVHRYLTAAASAAAALAFATPANAAGDTATHQLLDATGSSFTCSGTLLTGTGGVLAYDYHVTTASNGSVRDNGHGTPHDVSLTDADGHTYRLAGAFSFTDTYDPTTGATIAGHISDQLTVLTADGQLVGRVAVVEHLRRDGSLRDARFGSCTDNND